MGDGYQSREGAVFCTECFTDRDLNVLQDIFKLKFGVVVTKQKRNTGWRLSISKSQGVFLFFRKKKTRKILIFLFLAMADFSKLVKPYMVESMFYKLGKHS